MRKYIFQFCIAIVALTAGAQRVQLTNLPTIYIDTENGAPILNKTDYVSSTITVVSDDQQIAFENKTAGVRGRGNATWDFDKKPYRIKFDKKINLLNMPAKAKNWVLLANHCDRSLMRNALAFEISRFVGLAFTPSVRFVDVVLNDKYLGNYMVTDQVQVNPGRIEIDEMDATCIEGEALTGGYHLEIDGYYYREPVYFFSPRRVPITIKSPDDDVIQSAQINYIKNYINDFETILFSDDFTDLEGSMSKIVDVESLINWYIICELTGNSDSFWSTHIYKKRSDDHLYFGPVWDFDIAFNNDCRLEDATRKLMRIYAHNYRTWITRFAQADWFNNAVYTRWRELLQAGIIEHLVDYIDDTAELLDESQELNFEKWDIFSESLDYDQYLFDTYDEYVDFLRNYIVARGAFLTEAFGDVAYRTEEIRKSIQSAKSLLSDAPPGVDEGVYSKETIDRLEHAVYNAAANFKEDMTADQRANLYETLQSEIVHFKSSAISEPTLRDLHPVR